MFKILLLIIFASGGIGIAEDPSEKSYTTKEQCEAETAATLSKTQQILDSDPRTRGRAIARVARCFSEKEIEEISKQKTATDEPIGEKVD